MQRHSISHSGLLPFQCKICAKPFSQSANLKTHIKNTHTEDFTDVDQFPLHPLDIQTKHEVSKAVNECEICGKSFSRGIHLMRHIHALHEGRKDYKCEFCGKLSTQLGNMREHIKKIHGE